MQLLRQRSIYLLMVRSEDSKTELGKRKMFSNQLEVKLGHHVEADPFEYCDRRTNICFYRTVEPLPIVP